MHLPIRAIVRTTCVLLTALAAIPKLTAQQDPPWLVLRQMEVAGSDFARDDIAGVLASDFDTMRRLQRGLDQDAADEVAERIATIHHVGGYRTAKATAKLVDGRLQVSVQPGSRFRWGGVRCDGNHALSTAKITAALTTPPKPTLPRAGTPTRIKTGKPQLPVGEFADTTPSKLRGLRKAVIAAYEDIARYGAEVEVDVAVAEDKLDLIVRVANEGSEVSISTVELAGDPDEATAKVIAAWVAPTAGTLATKDARERIRTKVESTGRYLQAEIAVAQPTAAGQQTTATVNVTVTPDPPAFDAKQLADAAWIDRALSRTLAKISAGEQIQFSAHLTEPRSVPSVMTVHPGTVRVSIGTKGFAVEADAVSWGDGPSEVFAAQLDPGGLQLVAGDSRASFARASGDLLSIQFQLGTTLHADGKSEFRWGFGASGGRDTEFVFDFHSSFAQRVLANVTSSHDGDDLVLEKGETTIRLGPDGEVRAQPVEFEIEGTKMSLGMSAKPPELLGHVDRELVTAEDARNKLLAAVLGQMVPHETDRKRIHAMARCLIEAGIEFPEASDGDNRPHLGGEMSRPPSLLAMITGFAQQPCVRRNWSGHIIPALACASGYVGGDPRTAQSALVHLVEKRKAGPLFVLAMAQLFGLTNNERIATNLRRVAQRRWSFDAIWNDAADLLANFPSLAGVPARTGALFRKDPALEQLFSDLPDGPDADVRAFRIGVRYWWGRGGESALKKLLLD